MLFPAFCFALGSALLTLSVWMFSMHIGFRGSRAASTTGWLKASDHRKNVYSGGKAGRFYKHWTDCVYVYRVDGREYSVSVGAPGVPGDFSGCARIVYQKKHPQRAYVASLSQPVHFAAIAIVALGFAALSVAAGLSLLA